MSGVRALNRVSLGSSGVSVPSIGLGTWRFGEDSSQRRREVNAVRRALELGYRLIDTAEMYGEGGAEEVVGEAVAGAIADGIVTRADLFVVSKVYPQNASRDGAPAACERSRRRLRMDYIDLYLLHWRGSVPLAETVTAMTSLVQSRHIHHWGVSNFDVDDMDELWTCHGGNACATNQVYYSPKQRGIEYDLLPWQRQDDHRVSTMAYSPIDGGSLSSHHILADIGKKRGVTAAAIAIAWVLRQENHDVIAIPKATSDAHLKENFDGATLQLTADELKAIDKVFKPPTSKQPLAMT